MPYPILYCEYQNRTSSLGSVGSDVFHDGRQPFLRSTVLVLVVAGRVSTLTSIIILVHLVFAVSMELPQVRTHRTVTSPTYLLIDLHGVLGIGPIALASLVQLLPLICRQEAPSIWMFDTEIAVRLLSVASGGIHLCFDKAENDEWNCLGHQEVAGGV
jgi:hypothetical protein